MTLLAFIIGILAVILCLSIISGGFLTLRTYTLACIGILVLPATAVLARDAIAESWYEAVLKRDVIGQRQTGWFFVAVIFFSAMVLHALVIYPNVSPAFGGGRHESVNVYVKTDGAKLLREMKFTAEPADPNLFAAEVILEYDDYLTLVASEGAAARTAVRLKRDEVQSIITRRIFALRAPQPAPK